MFTGLIEGLGTVAAVRPTGQGKRLTLATEFGLTGSKIGDSICVSGACLTAVTVTEHRFEVDVSPETLTKTTLGAATTGDRVNIERAMRLSDRIDGHLVSGHVDGIGRIRALTAKGNYTLISVAAPPELLRYMIQKGSVAVDGISLTINDCGENRFDVSVIPHTAALTTLGRKRIGDPVNIETDMIGKYVERFLNHPGGDAASARDNTAGIDRSFLAKHGYL
jgi:riboflavin synthase